MTASTPGLCEPGQKRIRWLGLCEEGTHIGHSVWSKGVCFAEPFGVRACEGMVDGKLELHMRWCDWCRLGLLPAHVSWWS